MVSQCDLRTADNKESLVSSGVGWEDAARVGRVDAKPKTPSRATRGAARVRAGERQPPSIIPRNARACEVTTGEGTSGAHLNMVRRWNSRE